MKLRPKRWFNVSGLLSGLIIQSTSYHVGGVLRAYIRSCWNRGLFRGNGADKNLSSNFEYLDLWSINNSLNQLYLHNNIQE